MKGLRCLVGHHDWEAKTNREGEPYEVCRRTNCLKIRKTASLFDAYTSPDSRSPAPWWE